MLALFILFYEINLADGYKELQVSEERPASIHLRNQTFYVIESPKSLITKIYDDEKHLQQLPFYDAFSVKSPELFFESKTDPVFGTWILDSNFCDVSSLVNAENKMEVHAITNQFKKHYCIFSQAFFKEASLSIDIDPFPQSIEFIDQGLRTRSKCKKSEHCSYTSKSPFLLRITGNPEVLYNIVIDYSVHHPSDSVHSCSFSTLPLIEKTHYHHFQYLFSKDEQKCKSLAEEMIFSFKLAGIITGSIILTILIIQWTGLYDIAGALCPDEETTRFNRIKTEMKSEKEHSTEEIANV